VDRRRPASRRRLTRGEADAATPASGTRHLNISCPVLLVTRCCRCLAVSSTRRRRSGVFSTLRPMSAGKSRLSEPSIRSYLRQRHLRPWFGTTWVRRGGGGRARRARHHRRLGMGQVRSTTKRARLRDRARRRSDPWPRHRVPTFLLFSDTAPDHTPVCGIPALDGQPLGFSTSSGLRSEAVRPRSRGGADRRGGWSSARSSSSPAGCSAPCW